ncbi:hypothetical protein K440DRAFT_618263 [Wilcoxina mikolae CBS 423.85]|nr:hypothetical protein K440DRAFT_618263 [Wilcoxina mikolae CBS 423.85]
MTTTNQSYPNGYGKFADLISRDPELSIYRQFSRLSAQNLLYLQSELRALEDDFDRFKADDIKGERQQQLPNKPYLLGRSFEELQADSKSNSASRNTSKERIKKIMRARRVMKEYHEALVLEAQVLSLPKPSRRVRTVAKTWFEQKRPLVGLDFDLFDDELEEDLVALKPAQGQDRLSIFLQEKLGGIIQTRSSTSQTDDIVGHFSEKHIILLVNAITMIAAAILLVGAIAGLYSVRSEVKRLWMVGCLTLLFAVAVGTLTNARRTEIFASTAAYCP